MRRKVAHFVHAKAMQAALVQMVPGLFVHLS